MIRKATERDIARIVEIRANVSENALSDPSKVTLEDIRWFIVNPGIFVSEDENRICGFSSADTGNGSIWALFVDGRHGRRRIGRALLKRACTTLKSAGFGRIWLTTDPRREPRASIVAPGGV